MKSPRYLCIHGHFYQPPRENPWLDVVEVQDSAEPFHDWNERITRECYAPNTRARLLDARGQIIDLLNNYAWMSFNFGPTLLSWLADCAPEVLEGLVEADRLSRERRRGHGNALAQVYNHVIMPLASAHDQKTQVVWGLADFRHRFGREPEGMWLAETAVDLATLEALAVEGLRFTVLAPHQARRWRRLGDGEAAWHEIPGGIDPSRAYLCKLPSGRSIALFFYDGIISRQVAFERLLDNGEAFLARLRQGFDPARRHAQLMHIATDGESYGHHHAHGDMALAYVLRKLSLDPEVKLTNYGEFLELHPPEWEVEIHERSSWSCAHGVERWASDCGCKFRGDWHQQWRAPLRQAFDGLKQQLDLLFKLRGRACFLDPWEARNGYIDVVLNRGRKSVRHFLRQYGHPDLTDDQVRDALRLLEMQRNALLMYTSCAWFFDEISGLEATQCLHYAARALYLARLFQRDFEKRFVQALKQAPSNLEKYRNGKGVWDQIVRPAFVDLDRVIAHCAISLVFPTPDQSARDYSYDTEVIDQEVRSRGISHLAVGRIRVRSRLTWDDEERTFVVIHYGGLDFHAVLRATGSARDYDHLKRRLLDLSRTGSLADLTALVAREFAGSVHRLDDLFVDEQRRIIGILLRDRIDDYQRIFERLIAQDHDALARLVHLRHPIPKPLQAAAHCSLDLSLREELTALEGDGDLARVQALHERALSWDYEPERALLGKILAEALERTVEALDPEADIVALNVQAGRLLDAAALLGLPLDLWRTQNRLIVTYADMAERQVLTEPLRAVFQALAARLNLGTSLLGWRP